MESRAPVNTRSHHEPSLWDETRHPAIRFCHRATFALILFVFVYAVVAYGTTQTWHQGPLVAAVGLAAIFWAIRIVLAREVEVAFTSLGAPLILAGIYAIIRYALIDVEPVGRPSMLFSLTAIMFFFVVVNEVRHRWQVTTVVWTLAGLGALLAGYGLLQVLVGGRWVLGARQYEPYWGRASGTFFRPEDLAVFLQIAGAIAAANFALSRRSPREKVGFAFVCLAVCGGQLLSYATMHWAGLATMLVVVFVFVVRKRSWRFRWLLAGAGILAVVVIAVIASSHVQPGPAAHPAPPVRALWRSALAIGQRNIWLGGGGGMFPWLYPAHRTVQGLVVRCPNQYLDALAEYGVAGLVLLLWVGLGFLIAAIQIVLLRDEKYTLQRLSNRYAFAVAGVAGLAACVVDAGIDLNLHAGGILFPLLGVMAVTLTCGIHRRVGENRANRLGQFLTVRLHGLSRLVLAAGLVGLVLVMADRSRKIYPAQFLLRRGQQALALMNWDGAELSFKRAWKLDNRSYQAAEALGDLQAARATWNLQRRAALCKEAFIWYQRALTINPYLRDVQVKMGVLNDALGQRADALAAYRAALDKDPRNASYRVRLAQHFLRWGDETQAQQNFRIARNLGTIEILPGDETASRDRDGS